MKTKYIAMIGLLAALISSTAFQASAQQASPFPTTSPTKGSSNKKKPSPTPSPASPSPAAVSPTPGAATPSATKSLREKYTDAHRKLTKQPTPTPATTTSSREKYMDAHRPRFPQLKVSKTYTVGAINVEAYNMVPNHTYCIGIWGGNRTEPYTKLYPGSDKSWTLKTDSAGNGVLTYLSVSCICSASDGCSGAERNFGRPNKITIGLYEPDPNNPYELGVGPLVQITTPICQ